MERVCILVSDEHLAEVRQTVRDAGVANYDVLNVPVSATGKMPATHWFCLAIVDDNQLNKLLSLKNHTEMETGIFPKKFLADRNLKNIK